MLWRRASALGEGVGTQEGGKGGLLPLSLLPCIVSLLTATPFFFLPPKVLTVCPLAPSDFMDHTAPMLCYYPELSPAGLQRDGCWRRVWVTMWSGMVVRPRELQEHCLQLNCGDPTSTYSHMIPSTTVK